MGQKAFMLPPLTHFVPEKRTFFSLLSPGRSHRFLISSFSSYVNIYVLLSVLTRYFSLRLPPPKYVQIFFKSQPRTTAQLFLNAHVNLLFTTPFFVTKKLSLKHRKKHRKKNKKTSSRVFVDPTTNLISKIKKRGGKIEGCSCEIIQKSVHRFIKYRRR